MTVRVCIPIVPIFSLSVSCGATPSVRATGHKTPGESSEIRMRLLEGSSTLYTSLSVRVGRIRAKLVCLSITSKQAKVAPECCYAV